jgi:hypothetical protein
MASVGLLSNQLFLLELRLGRRARVRDLMTWEFIECGENHQAGP